MSADKIHIFQFATNPVCAPYRLDAPGRLLNQSPSIKITRFDELDTQIYTSLQEEGDMLIIQRLPMSPRLGRIISALNRAGKLIVFEIDDDLLNLNPDSKFAKLAPPEYDERIKQTILHSQAVQCSTANLAEVISEFHPEVAVLENHLEKLPPFTEKKIAERPVIVGYAAGEHHWPDWLTIKDAYNRVVQELEITGHKIETWVIGDEDIFESLNTANKKYFPLLARDKYLQVLQCFDISLIPLADNPFNRCKSDLKFLESAACSCAVIASTIVYSDSIASGETGLLFSGREEFEQCLKRLIVHPDLRVRLQKNAYHYVKRYRLLARHIEKWETTYQEWVKKKSALFVNTPVCK